MQQLIKITSEPMRMVRFSQNARLVNSDNLDMERRKAIARQKSFRSSAGQHGISVEDLKEINYTFSKKSAELEASDGSYEQTVSRQAQPYMASASSLPMPVQKAPTADNAVLDPVPAATTTSSESVSVPDSPDISVQTSSSYTAQRGAFEMRVAKGELAYLPPLVMTIITQRPQVHVEYVGDFNYVPPRDGDSGSNVNLFT